MVGTKSVAVNRVDPSNWKTGSLKVMDADVLVASMANAVDMLGACEKTDNVKNDNAKMSKFFFMVIIFNDIVKIKLVSKGS